MIPPESSFGPILEYLDSDKGFRTFAGEFLSSIGTGIGDLTLKRQDQRVLSKWNSMAICHHCIPSRLSQPSSVASRPASI